MSPAKPARNDVDAALAVLSADELREVVRELLRELDERAHSRVVNSLISRAARSGSGWAPAALGDDDVSEVLVFVESAKGIGQADPLEADGYLRRGSGAFLRKDYSAAHQILGALLRPIGNGEIDLGQHEMIDEVLGADTAECAAQYVVSAYMIAPPAKRAESVRAAIDEMHDVGRFWEPIREMERAAVEPLPGLHHFLRRWRALIAHKPNGDRRSDWDTDEERWLREVIQRLEGSDGLAKLSRSTKRAADLRAWCQSLVDARDWKADLAAFEEAAGLVADKDPARGDLLDGAALAAQSLGRKDLSTWLEQAWRTTPSMLRLRRWRSERKANKPVRGHSQVGVQGPLSSKYVRLEVTAGNHAHQAGRRGDQEGREQGAGARRPGRRRVPRARVTGDRTRRQLVGIHRYRRQPRHRGVGAAHRERTG